MEHDMNASSFTVRVVASTLADPYAAASAGLASLKGPLHGGANEAAMEMLLGVRDPAKAGKFLDETFREGRKLMGFGHRVYKAFDPRARLCKEYLKQMTERRREDAWLYELCDTVEKAMWERKRIPPNLDYYAAPYSTCSGSRCHCTRRSSRPAGSSAGWRTTTSRSRRTS